MKQCPNPNCMLYTRLEELPDAYVKCPGCGGQLVDADVSSRVLSSGHLTKGPASYVPLTSADAYEEEDPQLLQAQTAQGDQYDYDEGDAYGYAEDADGYGYTMPPQGQQHGLLGGLGGKLSVVMVGLLLLLCAGGGILLGSRFLPQNGVLSSPEATETVLASLRPPVNTPISILPTIPEAGFTLPTASPAGQPAQATPVAQPPANPQPATPAAPPVAADPRILDARMSVRLEGGQPVGDVKAYAASNAFNLSVQANYGPGGVTSVLTRWFGPDGSQVYEVRKDFSQAGNYYSGFTLKKDKPWATGDYRVDIYPNNSPTPASSVSFTVVP